jgi:hypothetical protein
VEQPAHVFDAKSRTIARILDLAIPEEQILADRDRETNEEAA